MLITTAHDDILLLLRPTLSGVISHIHISQDCSWYGTMIVPRPILYFHSSSDVELISPLTLEERRKKKRYIHVFPSSILFFDFKQVIAQKFR